MGRKEKPLDPAAGPVARFASELRKLRREAGTPTYRDMAREAGFSAPTLSAAAAGVRLPSLAVVLAYAAVCGGDTDEWRRRWQDAVEETAEEAAAAPAVTGDHDDPPYRGLSRFEPGDRELYFGREELVAEIAGLALGHRLSAVVGASGSGKSSLLRAGLIPALRGEPGRVTAVRILTPGARPLHTHRAALVPAPGDGDTVLVVDQFEELFTLCRDPAERLAFVDRLLTARCADGGLRVVLAVRADFFGHLARLRELAEAVRSATLLVTPMSAAQLRETIVKPAAARRLTVERALTARIVADVDGEPGALPLMSHALLEVWRRRRGKALTMPVYEAIGGVQGAIAHTAEELYRRLGPEQARIARAVLLRLISPGDGTQDTRRPADRRELLGPHPGPDAAHVLECLVSARLLTADTHGTAGTSGVACTSGADDAGGTVELAHEALITGWPRLRGWIEEDRERLRLHRHLTQSAREWEELDRDTGALYRGAQLSAAREAFTPVPEPDDDPSPDLGPLERDFLAASVAEEEGARCTALRTARRLRGLAVALSVLLCLAVTAGLLAWQQGRTNSRQRDEAEARRIATVSATLRLSDPRTAMRLGLAAWRIADLPETRAALAEAAAQPETDVFPEPGGSPGSPAGELPGGWRHYSPDGRVLTLIGGSRTERWDMAAHRRLGTLPGIGKRHDEQAVADVSRDGRTLVYRERGRLRLWDVASGRPVGRPFARTEFMDTAHFGAGDRLIVITGTRPSHGVQVWDTRSRRLVLKARQTRTGNQTPVTSPDGRFLAYCPDGGPVQIWDIRERRRTAAGTGENSRPPMPRSLCSLQQAQFTPDGRGLSFTTDEGVRTWEVTTGKERPRLPASGLLEAAFSADGAYAATVDEKEIRLWRTADASTAFRYRLAGAGRVYDLRLDIAHRQLRYQSGAQAPVQHTLSLPALDPPDAGTVSLPRVDTAEFSPDGGMLATAGPERPVELRDAGSGRRTARLPGLSCAGCRTDMAFSADGRTFAHLTGVDENAPSVAVRSLGSRAPWLSTHGPRAPGSRTPGPRARDTGAHDSRTHDSRTPERTRTLRPGRGPQVGTGRQRAGVSAIALTPRGGSVVVSRHGTELWDVDRGARSVLRRDHIVGDNPDLDRTDGDVLLLTPDGRRLLTDESRLIDLRTGRAGRVLAGEGHLTNAAYSPDGRHLAVSTLDGRTTLWDGAGRRRLAVLTPDALDSSGRQPALAFSGDSTRLAVGQADGSVRVWATATPNAAPAPLPAADGPVLALAFARDDTVLRVATPRSLRSGALEPRPAAETVCERARGGLGRAAWREHLPSVPYRDTCS